jgi:serine/threonine protein kinase
MLNSLIGQFSLDKLLYENINFVFNGTHISTKTPVVIKLFYKLTEKEQTDIKKIQTFSHPNIHETIHFESGIDYITHREMDMIVLDPVDSISILDFILEMDVFTEGLALAYFQQLLDGLNMCHSNNIFHRNINADNILLSLSTFELKITDLGLISKTNISNGVRFMTPESLNHLPQLDVMTDVFSCGVILFIMLTGVPPFGLAIESDWFFNKLKYHRYDEFWGMHARNLIVAQRILSIPKDAKDIIHGMLEADPVHRWTIAQVASNPWFNRRIISKEAVVADMNLRFTAIQNQKKTAKLREHSNHDDDDDDDDDDDVERSVAPGYEDDDDESVEYLPPIFENHSLFNVYTFRTAISSVKIFKATSQVFRRFTHSSTMISDAREFTLRASGQTEQGMLDIFVSCFRESSGPVIIVNVKRCIGDIFDFRAIFSALQSELTHQKNSHVAIESNLTEEEIYNFIQDRND